MTAVAYARAAASSLVLVNQPGGESGPLVAAMTVDNNPNRLLVAHIGWMPGAGNQYMFDEAHITSVLFNTKVMTFIGSSFRGGRTVEVYCYVGPSVGSGEVYVTFDGVEYPGENMYLTASLEVVSLYNVNQSAPILQSLATAGADRPITATLTATADNMLVDGNLSVGATGLTTTQTGQADRWQQTVGTLGATGVYAQSTKPIGSSGSSTMSWNQSVSKAWAQFTTEVDHVVNVPGSVGTHTSAAGSIHAGVFTSPLPVVDLYPSDGGWSQTRERKKRVAGATMLVPASALSSVATLTAHGSAVAKVMASARSQSRMNAIGYVGPSDEDVAGVMALLLNRLA